MNKMSPVKGSIAFLHSGAENSQQCWVDGSSPVKWTREQGVCSRLLIMHRTQKCCILTTNSRTWVFLKFLVLSQVRLFTTATCMSIFIPLIFELQSCLSFLDLFLQEQFITNYLNLIFCEFKTQKTLCISVSYPSYLQLPPLTVFPLFSAGHQLQI